MNSIPYTILSSAISLDGYLDDTSSQRLILSNEEDLDKIDALRATCDAILVGANTLRTDDPRLRIRSKDRIQARLRAGKPEHLIKATLTSSGNLSETARFFDPSDNEICIYCTEHIANNLPESIQHRAVILPGEGNTIHLKNLLEDLKRKGVEKLLIEGGQKIATMCLKLNLIHEYRVAIAPFFLGEKRAPRFVDKGHFPFDKNNRMHLDRAESVGDMAVITYKLQNP